LGCYLDELNLSNNQLSGSLPVEIGNMCYLGELNLSNNQFSGAIPTELGNLSSLRVLRLNNNRLTDYIPKSFTNLIYLADPGGAPDGGDGLDLDYNVLTVPVGYPNPTNPLHAFLMQKDPQWQALQSFTQIIGSAGGTLTSLDGRTEFVFPAGALITDSTFTFTPQPVPNYSPAGERRAQHFPAQRGGRGRHSGDHFHPAGHRLPELHRYRHRQHLRGHAWVVLLGKHLAGCTQHLC
jgi:hypothetical protein